VKSAPEFEKWSGDPRNTLARHIDLQTPIDLVKGCHSKALEKQDKRGSNCITVEGRSDNKKLWNWDDNVLTKGKYTCGRLNLSKKGNQRRFQPNEYQCLDAKIGSYTLTPPPTQTNS